MARKVMTTIRMDEKLKQAAQKSAKLQNRSLANLIEILLEQDCKKNGIKI
jgi:hypothetical protein